LQNERICSLISIYTSRVFLKFDLPDRKDIQRPQLFYRNIEMVVKQDFSVFWWWQ